MNAPLSEQTVQDRSIQRIFESLLGVMDLLQGDPDKACQRDIEHEPLTSSKAWKRPAQLPTLPHWRRF
jgi:hypothetical protein